MKILKRQGMRVTPTQLRNLANELEIEFMQTLRKLNEKLSVNKINNTSLYFQ